MSEVVLDPRIFLQPSDELLSIVKDINSTTDAISEVLNGAEGKLTTEDLKWIRSHTPKEKKRELYLALQKSVMVLPSPVYPERDPELEKRCQKLRFQQEDREYRSMTRNVRDIDNSEKPLSVQFKELNTIIVMLVQFIVSVFASFLFGYMAPYLIWGRVEVGPRLLAGTLAAFFVGIADLYFVIREHLSEDGIRIEKKSN